MDRQFKVSVRDGGLVIHCSEHTLPLILTWITESFGARLIDIERAS